MAKSIKRKYNLVESGKPNIELFNKYREICDKSNLNK